MRKISAKIIADSMSPQGHRIISYILTYPRFIHSELMTHRMFSRNAASSRAIPFNQMVKMIEEDPFIPIAWQKDHKGMQGTEYITDLKDIEHKEICWKFALAEAIDQAIGLSKAGVTKQLCNRLLEPFMWYTVLVTATEYNNFFDLRSPIYNINGYKFKSKKDALKKYPQDFKYSELDWIKLSESYAEIHIQALAEAMWDARNNSTPKELKAGEWHIPFGNKILDESGVYNEVDFNRATKISTARCARLSYITFDGKIDYEKDIKLHDTLLKSKHLSCFEHCAKAMSNKEYYEYYKGNLQRESVLLGDEYGWCNNFRGFIQYRYLVE